MGSEMCIRDRPRRQSGPLRSEKESVALASVYCAWSVRQLAQTRPPVDNSLGAWADVATPYRGELKVFCSYSDQLCPPKQRG